MLSFYKYTYVILLFKLTCYTFLTAGYYYNDIWSSVDRGRTWNKVVTSGTIWSKRKGHAVAVVQDYILVMGGVDGRGDSGTRCF